VSPPRETVGDRFRETVGDRFRETVGDRFRETVGDRFRETVGDTHGRQSETREIVGDTLSVRGLLSLSPLPQNPARYLVEGTDLLSSEG